MPRLGSRKALPKKRKPVNINWISIVASDWNFGRHVQFSSNSVSEAAWRVLIAGDPKVSQFHRAAAVEKDVVLNIQKTLIILFGLQTGLISRWITPFEWMYSTAFKAPSNISQICGILSCLSLFWSSTARVPRSQNDIWMKRCFVEPD